MRNLMHDDNELGNLPPEVFNPFDPDGDEPFDPQDRWLSTAAKHEQLTAMREWFLARYCDPAHETPYNGSEGGYQYIHGGPYDPADVLPNRFSGIVDDNIIQDVIDEFHSEVGDKWAPVHHVPESESAEDHDVRVDERHDAPPLDVSGTSLKQKQPATASAELEWEDADFWNGKTAPAAPGNDPADIARIQQEDSARFQDVATKLDLAEAYLEMGDKKGAREILLEVQNEGHLEQREIAQKLLKEFNLPREPEKPIPRTSRKKKAPPEPDVPPQTSAPSTLSATRTEVEAESDLLGRERLTQALCRLLTEREDDHPFAIGLFGHWGTGKSSQVNFLQEELKKAGKAKILVAEFNAWQNEKATNLAAMLAQAVVDGLVADKGMWEKLKLAVRLAALHHSHTRNTVEQGGRSLFVWLSQAWPWAWVLLPPVGALLLLAPLLWWLPLPGEAFAPFIKILAGAAATLASAYHFMRSHLTEWFKRLDIKKSLSLLSLPDYSAHRGLILDIHRTLHDLCALSLEGKSPKEGSYLLLVVDDLDRCGVDTVKDVLDVVRLVTNIPRVVTLVAIDERMAFAAVEKHYHQFGHAGRHPALVARDYLAKVLQVSVTLPEVSPGNIGSYVDKKIFGDIGLPHVMQTQAAKENGVTSSPSDVRPSSMARAKPAEAPPLEQNPLPDAPAASAANQVPLQQSSLPREKELFKELARAYNFSNPRLLWRLYMGWKLLKSLTLSDTYISEEVEIPMQLLFWREWLRQLACEQRETYSDWVGNTRRRIKPPGMPGAIYDAVHLKLRPTWEKIMPLIGVVDAVLLPASSGEPAGTDKPQKQIRPKKSG